MGDVDPEAGHEAAVRHHRLDDAGRAPQPDRRSIDQSRRRRIAAGAGVQPNEVNELVKQFDAMAQMMTSHGRQGHARADENGPRAADAA